jgi:stage II sporulation protein AA (anti-sigma F factor antagonist)
METAVPVSVIKIKSYLMELEEWALYEHVKVAIDRDRIRFVLDFSGLTYINSRGIGVVAACVKAARDAGGDLMLCHLTDTIEKLFHISGMHRFIDIVPDEAAALALFASR